MTPDQYAVLARKEINEAAGDMTAAEYERAMNEINGDCYFENRRDEMEMDDE